MLDSKIPMNVRQFVLQTNISQQMYWVEIIDVIDGEPCTRLFAYKHTKTYGFECKEVGREFLDRNETSGSLYYGQLSGYIVAWGNRKYSQPYYPVDDNFYPTTDFWYPKVSKSILYTANEAYSILKNYIPYFSLNSLVHVFSVMEYARNYIKYPQVEMLAKAGFPYLYKDKRLFKLTKEKKRKVSRWIIENKDYMYTHQPTYPFIMMAIKNNEDAWKTHYRCVSMNHIKYMKSNGFHYEYEQMVELVKYLERQGMGIIEYKDYLEASQKLHRNISDRGVLFPRDLMTAHDEVMSLVDQKENKTVNRKLKKIYKLLEQYSYKYKGLQIVIPKTQRELVQWGEKLHNCVGTMGYGKKMANGNCIILGVFKDGVPVECCELKPKNEKSKKLKIEQLRGDHNQDSDYHVIAEKLIDKFISAYSIMNVVGASI